MTMAKLDECDVATFYTHGWDTVSENITGHALAGNSETYQY